MGDLEAQIVKTVDQRIESKRTPMDSRAGGSPRVSTDAQGIEACGPRCVEIINVCGRPPPLGLTQTKITDGRHSPARHRPHPCLPGHVMWSLNILPNSPGSPRGGYRLDMAARIE